MSNSLNAQFEEDLNALSRHLITSGPLPLVDVRVIASAICRKWFLDKRLAELCRNINVVPSFPAVDTSEHVKIINSDSDYGYYTAAGIMIEGKYMNSVYLSRGVSPEEGTSSLPVPKLKEFRLGTFMDRSCCFYEGTWISNREILKYMANKAGGVHYDKKREKTIFEKIDQARSLVKFGGPPTFGEELPSEVYFEVSSNTPTPWDCGYIELCSIAQGLMNIRFDGKPLIPTLESKSLVNKTVTNPFDSSINRFFEE